MPIINFSFKDLQNLLKRKITIEQLKESLVFCKAEVEHYDEKEDLLSVNLQDTNLPYLWSAEGVARLLKGVLGIEKGIPLIKIKKGNYQVHVDKSVKGIRPYLFALVATGYKIDDYILKQLIQLQEKMCESYGRRRKFISIGIYSYKNIQFPVYYKAVSPESASFIPLEFREKINLGQILLRHPKGREYAWILEGFDKYPIFLDSKQDVLSFPPIINSDFLGKVLAGDTDLFIEVTGTDFEMTRLANNIFAHALQERGFDIYSVTVNYPDKKIVCPDNNFEKMKITGAQVEKLTGISLEEKELKTLLGKARYNYDKGFAEVPSYRRDVLHWVDVAEDAVIIYDFKKIKPLSLTTYTVGKTFEITNFANKFRELLVGLGCQEVFSPILNSKIIMTKNMLLKAENVVEIENPMSENFSTVRNSITPVLLDVLGKNKHAEYPHRIFEQGLVTIRNKDSVKDYEMLSCAVSHKNADFTEIRQILEAILNPVGLSCKIKNAEHPSYIPGRCGEVLINNKNVGIVGEICPEVLSNFGLALPVVCFEINLTESFK